MGDDNKKKYGLIGVSSLLLVAMVVGVAVSSKSDGEEKQITASNKAVDNICAPTDYKETCLKSLNEANPNSSDPRDLIKLAFDVTIKSIKEGMAEATKDLKQKAQKDKKTKGAFDSCEELMDNAIEDLRKSFNKIEQFNFEEIEDFVEDLRVWLSGAVTFQQTCIDGFEGIDTEAGETLEKVFRTAKELTSNGLAIVTNLSKLLQDMGLNIPGLTGTDNGTEDQIPARKLLSSNQFPSWITHDTRRLLAAPAGNIKADAEVAQDGSGQYKTITEALNAVPMNNMKRFVIHIKEGVYKEKVELTRKMANVTFLGDGPTKTRITGNLCFVPSGVNTYRTATVAVGGEWFMAKDIGFENTAGAEGHQAVALRVSADYAVFHNCHMDGYQDTLYTHTHRQFYRECSISGTIDFVFGDGKVVLQKCEFIVRKPMANQQCIVTAQGRTDKRESTGLVLQDCHIKGDPGYIPFKTQNMAYMGRPWKEYSRTIIMNTMIDDIIQPEGWLKWNDTFAFNTLFYAEFNNKGPGAVQTGRVKWRGVRKITEADANRYAPARFLRANQWIPQFGVPYTANLN